MIAKYLKDVPVKQLKKSSSKIFKNTGKLLKDIIEILDKLFFKLALKNFTKQKTVAQFTVDKLNIKFATIRIVT